MLHKVRKHSTADRAKVGGNLKFSDGALMQVQKDGSLRRVGSPKLRKKDRIAKRKAEKSEAAQLAALGVKVEGSV